MDGWVYEKLLVIEGKLDYLLEKLQEAEKATKKGDK